MRANRSQPVLDHGAGNADCCTTMSLSPVAELLGVVDQQNIARHGGSAMLCFMAQRTVEQRHKGQMIRWRGYKFLRTAPSVDGAHPMLSDDKIAKHPEAAPRVKGWRPCSAESEKVCEGKILIEIIRRFW